MKTLKLWREVTLGGVFAAGEGEDPVKARYTLSAESIARHDALNDQLIEAAEAKRGQRKTQADISDHYRMRLEAHSVMVADVRLRFALAPLRFGGLDQLIVQRVVSRDALRRERVSGLDRIFPLPSGEHAAEGHFPPQFQGLQSVLLTGAKYGIGGWCQPWRR